MSDEEIAVEYEADLAWSGKVLKVCPTCGGATHQEHCMTCVTEDGEPIALTGNPTIDRVMSMIENGQGDEIEDLEALLRAGFVPVQRGEQIE